MKKIFGTLALICFVTLVPFIMALFMLFTKDSSMTYNILSSIQSLFSIPTSIIGFALQYDLGDVWWVVVNALLFILSIVITFKN
jgi:hypothetical protein